MYITRVCERTHAHALSMSFIASTRIDRSFWMCVCVTTIHAHRGRRASFWDISHSLHSPVHAVATDLVSFAASRALPSSQSMLLSPPSPQEPLYHRAACCRRTTTRLISLVWKSTRPPPPLRCNSPPEVQSRSKSELIPSCKFHYYRLKLTLTGPCRFNYNY